jgi:hypothetical protein
MTSASRFVSGIFMAVLIDCPTHSSSGRAPVN